MKRWIIIAVIVAVLAGAFLLVRGRIASTAAGLLEDLQTVEATTGRLTAVVGATGVVRASQSALLAFETSGTVERVSVEVGDPVEAGEVLVSLDQASLSPQVILAQADLVAAQRALDELMNSTVAQAQAEVELAQARDALHDAEYNRTVMQQGNRASQDTIDAARARVVLARDRVAQAEDQYGMFSGRSSDDPLRASALGNLAAARLELRSAERSLSWYVGYPTDIDQAILDANVALAQARLARAELEWERLRNGPDPEDVAAAEARVVAAQATLDMARIAAPFDGTVTSLSVVAGDPVAPGTLAVGLADLSHLRVNVEVSEVDINRVRLGQAVELMLDAVLGRTYDGRVVEVGLSGVSAQGVVNFPVTVEFLDPDENVRPGMTAAVNIVVEEIEDVLLVPNRAVRVREGERVVYVLREGRLEPVTVVLGASSDTDSQVLEGDLNPGDPIVLNPPLEFDTNGPPSFMR